MERTSIDRLASTGQNLETKPEQAPLSIAKQKFLNELMDQTFASVLDSVPLQKKEDLFNNITTYLRDDPELTPSEVFLKLVEETFNRIERQNPGKIIEKYSPKTTELSFPVNINSMLSTSEVAEIIEKTPNTVNYRLKQSRLVGYTQKDGKNIYPAWQFSGNKTLPGLQEVLAELKINGVRAIRSFITPLERSNGKSILELLIEGNTTEAIKMAEILKDQA